MFVNLLKCFFFCSNIILLIANYCLWTITNYFPMNWHFLCCWDDFLLSTYSLKLSIFHFTTTQKLLQFKISVLNSIFFQYELLLDLYALHRINIKFKIPKQERNKKKIYWKKKKSEFLWCLWAYICIFCKHFTLKCNTLLNKENQKEWYSGNY